MDPHLRGGGWNGDKDGLKRETQHKQNVSRETFCQKREAIFFFLNDELLKFWLSHLLGLDKFHI